jgi:hypothetical protein
MAASIGEKFLRALQSTVRKMGLSWIKDECAGEPSDFNRDANLI